MMMIFFRRMWFAATIRQKSVHLGYLLRDFALLDRSVCSMMPFLPSIDTSALIGDASLLSRISIALARRGSDAVEPVDAGPSMTGRAAPDADEFPRSELTGYLDSIPVFFGVLRQGVHK